ncbi:peptidoglycan DD-metalloendopeptidase family protein [Marinicrinis sediminis]|uniref:Peptidoglycan DD-metalloendopeptidase family protein n=1 Tax=Marinicrinis sediminis TaxID=1652465 RepID=A0ABW5R7A6_9BACL
MNRNELQQKEHIRIRRQARMKKLVQASQNRRNEKHTTDEVYAQAPNVMHHQPDTPLHDPEWLWKQEQKKKWRGTDTLSPYSVVFSWFRIHLFICIGLFILVWILFQTESTWSEPGRQFVRTAMHESIQFEQLEAWYAERFDDSPSFLPSFGGEDSQSEQAAARSLRKMFVPLAGEIEADFSDTGKGVWIKPRDETGTVVAMDTGRVMFAGKTEELGSTLIIQHANQLHSVYGHFTADVYKKDDWIEGGEQIGTIDRQQEQNGLFFAIVKQETYLDPLDVVAFD